MAHEGDICYGKAEHTNWAAPKLSERVAQQLIFFSLRRKNERQHQQVRNGQQQLRLQHQRVLCCKLCLWVEVSWWDRQMEFGGSEDVV